MPDFDAVSTEHVLRALTEYDERGRDDFLDHYGFGVARDYVLIHENKSYDSKALLCVAHKYAKGVAARANEFSGGKDGAAKVLQRLGFEVTVVEDVSGADTPATDVWRDASEVGMENAKVAWAEAAREVLLDAARLYHSVVTYGELQTQIQHRTCLRTKQLMHYWIGDVLGRVAADSARRGEPLLSALCVNAEGSVGTGYAVAVADALGETTGDPDDHAAHGRLACYRHFNASGLPADGGVSALTPKPAATRSRRRAKVEAPLQVCPTCHMQLLAPGRCDNCD